MEQMNLAEKISRWSVFILCGLLPFFFIPAAWASIGQAKMAFVIVLVVVATISWVAAALSAGSLRLPKSSLLIAAALVPVAYLVSALVTGASLVSFVGGSAVQDTVVTVLIWYALLVACVNVFSSGAGRLVAGVRVILLGGLVVLFMQIAHLAVPSFTFGGALVGQAASVVGSWHDLSIFLGFLLFLALALIPSPLASSRPWKLGLIIIAILSGGMLFIASFRDVLVTLGVVAAVYAGYLWFVSRRYDEISRRAFVRRAGLWVVFLVCVTGLYFGGDAARAQLPEQLQITRLEVRPSWQGTFAIGTQVFSQPSTIFFGTGPNTFPREWGMHKPLSVNTTQFWNVDFYAGVGFIPTSFLTVGLLGVVAWTAVCFALALSIWRVFRMRSESSSVAVLHAALVASAAFLTVFHVLYVPGPALSALTFILFGAVITVEFLAGGLRELPISLAFNTWRGRISAGILTLFVFVLLLGGIQSTRALISEMLVNRGAVVYNEDADVARASQNVTRAILVWPGNDRAHRAAVELGIIQFTQLASAGANDETAVTALQATLTNTVEHGLAAVTIGGANYQNWLSLARLYGELAGAGVEGAEERARSAYEETFKNNPTNPLPLLELAQMDLLQGDDAKARENLNAALTIKPDLAVAHFLLSQIDARGGDLESALQRAGAVVQLAPDDALGWYNLGTILYAQKDYTNSALAFERAVGIQNDYSNALFLLGASYAYAGRLSDAVTALRAVESLNPTNTTIGPMIETLEAGDNPFAAGEAENL